MRQFALLVGAVAAGGGAQDSEPVQFVAECHDDNMLTVEIPFFRPAEIRELTYGICNKNSTGITGLDQNPGDFSFSVTLDMAECDMDSRLRTIEYEQVVYFRIGKMSTDITTGEEKELNFAEFVVESYCEVEDTYEVVFDYGQLTVVKDNFTDSAGGVNISFIIRAYNSDFNSTDDHSTIAGDMIYLGLTLADDQPFDWDSKTFAPEMCRVYDTVNSLEYTLFDASVTNGCQNDDVDLTVGYNSTTHMWTFQHILFLLADEDESTFLLKCTVKVCDKSIPANSCDAIKTECGLNSGP